MRGVAAPVRDASGSVVGSVGMGGPVQRITKKKLREFIPHVVETADIISSRLGFSTLS
jgi:DNA-binding IclR family transcriptional regulator